MLKQFLRRLILYIVDYITVRTEIEKRNERVLKRERRLKKKQKILFRESYYLGNHMNSATWMISYLCYFIFGLSGILLLIGSCLIPINLKQDITPLILFVVSIGALALARILRLVSIHISENVTLYCERCLCVCKHGREDVIVTYEELGQYIREKKIRIGHGRLELPLKKGTTPIYIHEHPEMDQKESLIQFINEKCGVNIPILTKDEKILIRKSGLAPVCMWTFLSMALADLLIVTIGFFSEGNYSLIDAYVCGSLKEFWDTHPFLVLGLPIGIWGIFAGLNSALDLSEFSKYDIFRG